MLLRLGGQTFSAEPSAALEEPRKRGWTKLVKVCEVQPLLGGSIFCSAALTVSASTSWAFLLSPWRGWPSLVSSALSFGTVSADTSSKDISVMVGLRVGKPRIPHSRLSFFAFTCARDKTTQHARAPKIYGQRKQAAFVKQEGKRSYCRLARQRGTRV